MMTPFTHIMKMKWRVVFRKEKGHYGCSWTEQHEPRYIVINLALHERKQPIRTFFHECLHLLHPMMTEAQIRTLEDKLWKRLTVKQKFALGQKLYNRKWRSR